MVLNQGRVLFGTGIVNKKDHSTQSFKSCTRKKQQGDQLVIVSIL